MAPADDTFRPRTMIVPKREVSARSVLRRVKTPSVRHRNTIIILSLSFSVALSLCPVRKIEFLKLKLSSLAIHYLLSSSHASHVYTHTWPDAAPWSVPFIREKKKIRYESACSSVARLCQRDVHFSKSNNRKVECVAQFDANGSSDFFLRTRDTRFVDRFLAVSDPNSLADRREIMKNTYKKKREVTLCMNNLISGRIIKRKFALTTSVCRSFLSFRKDNGYRGISNKSTRENS